MLHLTKLERSTNTVFMIRVRCIQAYKLIVLFLFKLRIFIALAKNFRRREIRLLKTTGVCRGTAGTIGLLEEYVYSKLNTINF